MGPTSRVALNDPNNSVDSSSPNQFEGIALIAGQQAQNYTFTHQYLE